MPRIEPRSHGSTSGQLSSSASPSGSFRSPFEQKIARGLPSSASRASPSAARESCTGHDHVTIRCAASHAPLAAKLTSDVASATVTAPAPEVEAPPEQLLDAASSRPNDGVPHGGIGGRRYPVPVEPRCGASLSERTSRRVAARPRARAPGIEDARPPRPPRAARGSSTRSAARSATSSGMTSSGAVARPASADRSRPAPRRPRGGANGAASQLDRGRLWRRL